MASETIKEQLERILREHAVLPVERQEKKKLQDRLKKREVRLKKPNKDTPK